MKYKTTLERHSLIPSDLELKEGIKEIVQLCETVDMPRDGVINHYCDALVTNLPHMERWRAKKIVIDEFMFLAAIKWTKSHS